MNDYDKPTFIIGKENSDYLKFEIENYSYPNSNNLWDSDFLDVRTVTKAGAFKGDFKCQLRNIDFSDLKESLENLYNNLKGEASFESTEYDIKINIKGDGLGHFTCDCTLIDSPDIYGTKLLFILAFDQTEIPNMIKMINEIIDAYPVRGTK